MVLFALVVALGGTVLAVRFAHAGEVLPGTRVAGLELGGVSEGEARRRIAAFARSQAPVALKAGRRKFVVNPTEAGYAIDVAATADKAMRAGRDGPVAGAFATAAGLLKGHELGPAATVDPARLRAATARIARRIDRRPSVGTLAIERDSLAVQPQGRRAGQSVDRQRLTRLLRDALHRSERTTITIPIRQSPAASAARISALAQAARMLLRQPLVLSGSGLRLTVTPRELAAVLRLQPLKGGRDARLGGDRRKLEALVARLAEKVDRPSRDAAIFVSARAGLLDAKGDVSWRPRPAETTVRAARRGRLLRRRHAMAAIDAAIRTGRHTAPLATAVVAPQITTSSARRVRRLIGTFTTRYQPGQPRVINIRRIAASVDGTVVAAGGQFSLNRTAGRRTRAKGYVEAPFIADDKIVPSVGGGVSQFSTTLYNAAYFAGLRLDTHQPHSLYIDRYPPGREATLNYPDIDLRWTNDTSAPVLVRAVADEDSVTVRLYGDNGARTVRAEAGPRRPVPGGDFAITVTRVVRHADGRVVRAPYTTQYRSEVTDE